MKTKEPSPDAMANTHTPNPLDGRVWVGIRVVFYIRVDKKLWRKIKSPLGWRKRMAAGNSIGIGDFRPEKRGPFGTFRVTRFEEADKIR
jgi:hypothetical protein